MCSTMEPMCSHSVDSHGAGVHPHARLVEELLGEDPTGTAERAWWIGEAEKAAVELTWGLVAGGDTTQALVQLRLAVDALLDITDLDPNL